MDFKTDKPIYRQVVDLCLHNIISGTWLEGARVPSVREMGAHLAVNPHTVLKAYDELQSRGLIEPRRGLGFILSPDARQGALMAMREEFLANEVSAFLAKMKSLGLSIEDVLQHYYS